jgi:DivIVA domain-containing protein
VAEQSAESDQPRREVPPEIRGVSFPVARRGYERSAVDTYVARVIDLIDDLEATRSPEAAVKHALREAGEKISSTLLQAGETAEEITVAARQTAEAETARARKEADELVTEAKADAEEIRRRSTAEAETIRAQARAEAEERLRRAEEEMTALKDEAEARLRELGADTETVRSERRALLDDIRALAARVEQAADGADARFPLGEAADRTQERAQETRAAANPDGNGAGS